MKCRISSENFQPCNQMNHNIMLPHGSFCYGHSAQQGLYASTIMCDNVIPEKNKT